jgi:hypothetical protein
MAEADPDRNSFEDLARAVADEVNRAVDRLSEIDADAIARVAGEEAERARRWLEELARSLRIQGDDPLRHDGPHPLDLPTPEQGAALAAIESGRWKLAPETATLGVEGEGPEPHDALGLGLELRIRDWITADGELTQAGRKALARWLDAA